MSLTAGITHTSLELIKAHFSSYYFFKKLKMISYAINLASGERDGWPLPKAMATDFFITKLLNILM